MARLSSVCKHSEIMTKCQVEHTKTNTQIHFNPVESKVANMPGLYFKYILEFLQRLGFFCCKQAINPETNSTNLVSVKAWLQCLCYIIFWIVLSCLQGTGFFVAFYSSKRHNETIITLYDTIHSEGYLFTNSNFDTLIFKSLTFCIYALHCVMIISTFQSKTKLGEVFNYLESIVETNDDQFAKNMKRHSLKIMLNFGCMSICFVGQEMKLMKILDLRVRHIALLYVSDLIFMFGLFAPILAFHFYFLEIILKFQSWMIKLRETLKTELNSHLGEIETLMIGLQMFRRAISSIIFCFFNFLMLLSIIEAYLTISYILSPIEFNIATLLLMIGFGFFGVLFLYLSYSYCIFSQSIKDSADEIKDIILKSNIGKQDTYVLDGKILRLLQSEIKKQKKRIILGFEEFKGFHGNGYFTLSKPLLTSVVANFVTYLIILIQFKITELSSSQ